MKWLVKLLALALFSTPSFAALQYIVGEAGMVTIVGLSSDTKPTIADGAVFFESDTAKVYLRTGGAWVESVNEDYATSFPIISAESGASPVNLEYYYGHTKRYGAVCDGSTDDTVEVQDAIDVASVLGGKAVIQATEDNCLVNTLTIDASNFTIEGEGRGSALKASGSIPASGAILVSLAGANADSDDVINQPLLDGIYGASVIDVRTNVPGSLENVHIRNLKFISNTAAIRAIHFTAFTRGSDIEGNAFENFDGAAVTINGSWSFTMRSNHVSGDGTNGIGFEIGTVGNGVGKGATAVNGINVIGNEITGHDKAFEWDFGVGGFIGGNVFEFIIGDCLESQSVEGVAVTGNYFEACGGDAIDMGGTNGTDLADSWVVTGNRILTDTGDRAIRLEGVRNSLIGFNDHGGSNAQLYSVLAAGSGGIQTGNTIYVPAHNSTYIDGSSDLSAITNFVYLTDTAATASVSGWVLGASTATTPSANDNDTSLATSAFVQGEIDDVDLLSDNCVLENDATPIPDSCVGNGSDAGGTYTFNADGDNNSPQTISDTDELLIAGGTNGVDTVASATDTVTINLDLSESASGGELGGNLNAPTIDDGVTVDAWVMGASTATSPAANDNDTSLATSAFVQSEIDDGDNLTDNCVVENDSTPIPDSCVGNGSDADTTDFNADGDNNSPQTINATNELLIAGGTNGVDTVASATDTITVNLDLSESPAGGELGGNLDAPTLDDGVTVDTWTLGSATVGATAAANDSDTSLATTAFVQQEVDDVDLLSDNCVLENDGTPIPDSCVGDGSDAGGGGGGLSYAEVVAASMAGY